MATRRSGFIQNIMEKFVPKPTIATLTVGTSILILMQITHELSSFWPEIAYLKYLVPFVPPFFITRTAKRINQRRGEDDPKDREAIVTQLIENFKKNNSYGILHNYQTSIKAKGESTSSLFFLNSVLKMKEGKLKWQATLMKYTATHAEQ